MRSFLSFFVLTLLGVCVNAGTEGVNPCSTFTLPTAAPIVNTVNNGLMKCINTLSNTWSTQVWTISNNTVLDNVFIENAPYLEEVHFPDLVSVVEYEFHLRNLPSLVYIDLPSLVLVQGTLHFGYNAIFDNNFNLPLLETTGGFWIQGNGQSLPACSRQRDISMPTLIHSETSSFYDLLGIAFNFPNNPRVLSFPNNVDTNYWFHLECGDSYNGLLTCDSDIFANDFCSFGHCSCMVIHTTSPICTC